MTRRETDAGSRRWSTASFGLPPDTSPMELSELGRHLDLCRLGGRGGTLQCALQAVRGFVAAHLVTSVAAAAIVIALVWLLS